MQFTLYLYTIHHAFLLVRTRRTRYTPQPLPLDLFRQPASIPHNPTFISPYLHQLLEHHRQPICRQISNKMAPTTRSNKRKADDAAHEDAAPKRRRRAPEDRNYHGRPINIPRRHMVTRGVHAEFPHVQLNPGLPYTGRLQDHPRPIRPVHQCAPFDWTAQYRNLEDAPDPSNGTHYQRGPPLTAAHNAALLQSATLDFRPLDPNSPTAQRPPPTWRPVQDGPQSHPITHILYGNLTSAAQARPGELVVNTPLQNATTAHRIGTPQRNILLSTALVTTPLADSHPLLLRADHGAPGPPQGPGLGHHPARLDTHPHLSADHPLLALAGLGRRLPQAVDADGVVVARSAFEGQPARVVEAGLARRLGGNMWGERRGRIEVWRTARDFVDGEVDGEVGGDGGDGDGEGDGAAN
ncbi:hypothetical protein CONLIGDRAFT_691988 [Coniochaeta ligniaria NRRL 30616]|uniref:Uncharacterized protein n=1 Tax=Coniochaeta ligniaria NRRL 30616 TaxID=1408157 RepID=A0A1J7J612_9PEZI|nr:hypothetical protein CONLIGDRAFT_691988 [Coniochaeta ligniaria NRRL 30616]